jgi:hypothetical protein
LIDSTRRNPHRPGRPFTPLPRADRVMRLLTLALLVGTTATCVGYLLARDWPIALLIGTVATIGAAISDDTAWRRPR